jgi:CRISPR/Cas system-associated exonuclease Cas4 (RecB family)
MIDVRLQVDGLYPYDEDLFYSLLNSDLTIDELNEHDHKKLASARAEKAINVWGPHLFPLIDSTELLIKGIRKMPNYDEKTSRSNYYGINGVVDVLSSMKINKNLNQSNLDNYNNKIIEFLKKDPEFSRKISNFSEGDEYEIIIDYKGMKRPPEKSINKFTDPWENHKQQILTYSWLRSRQEDAKPIFAGIIFYLNELVPSKEDLVLIQDEIAHDRTDKAIDYSKYANDVDLIMNWNEDDKAPELSEEFKIARSIRIINIDDKEIDDSLNKFDNVVFNIESSLIKEIKGCKIQEAWKADSDERTCNACDFRTFCKNNSVKTKDIKIP